MINITKLVLITLFSTLIILQATASDSSFNEAKAKLEKNTETKRLASAKMSFEEFKSSVYKEPFEGGKYIVNGDTPILNEKKLKEFFDKSIKNKSVPPSLEKPELILHQVGGLDAVWNNVEKNTLTYCISNTFGNKYTQAVAAMQMATRAWEVVAQINFIHLSSEDSNCKARNNAVAFDVRPVNVHGRYLARAFFPNEPRPARNVLIDKSSFELDPNGKLSLIGILRHELGHTLGFRHEHTRPNSGKCFEDTDWKPLTSYDPFSVMHYPQCNGLGDWSLTLTNTDKHGAACVYGAAPGFTVNTNICKIGDTPNTKSENFTNQTVAQGEKKTYGPFMVKPGTLFEAKIQAHGNQPGDPDLYLKFDGPVSQGSYDCRPYLSGANETCSVTVPSGKQKANIKVIGYTQGNYKLSVIHTSN